MNQALWEAWFDDLPMPDNCTYEQFVAAREALWDDEDTRDDVDTLLEYNELLTAFPQELELIKLLLRSKSSLLKRLSDARL